MLYRHLNQLLVPSGAGLWHPGVMTNIGDSTTIHILMINPPYCKMNMMIMMMIIMMMMTIMKIR